MDEQKLNDALYAKMFAEQQEYRTWLTALPPDEILDHANEFVVREDILVEMEALDLPAPQAAALLTSPTPLADVYREWNKVGTHHMEDIRDVIEDCTEEIVRRNEERSSRPEPGEIPKMNRTPIYQYPASYARENGEMEQYRASLVAHTACKYAIDVAIRDGWNGMNFAPGAAKTVLERFGPERVSFVLAYTVRERGDDERISGLNQNWARTIPLCGLQSGRGSCTLESHSAKVDLFIDVVRRDIRELEQDKPSVREGLKRPAQPGPDRGAGKPRSQER